MKKGQTARNRLSHLICPRHFHTGAGFGTWSPVTALAGRGGCRGFIGPVPLPLSIRLTVNIATTRRGVKRFSSPIGKLGSENRTNARSADESKQPNNCGQSSKTHPHAIAESPVGAGPLRGTGLVPLARPLKGWGLVLVSPGIRARRVFQRRLCWHLMTEPALMVLLDASKCMAEARTPEECCDVLLKSIDFLGVTEGWIAVTDPQERAIKVRSVFGGDAPSLAISQDVARFVAEQLSQSPRAAVLPKEAWPLGAFGSEVQEVLFVPLVANGRWLGAMVLKAPAGCAIGLDQFRMLADHAAIHLGNALLRADHERTDLVSARI